ERPVIERARRELVAGSPRAALVSLGAHQRDFPAGALAEERDVLWIQALLADGRADAARRRAAIFRRRHPESIHGPALEALTAEAAEAADPTKPDGAAP